MDPANTPTPDTNLNETPVVDASSTGVPAPAVPIEPKKPGFFARLFGKKDEEPVAQAPSLAPAPNLDEPETLAAPISAVSVEGEAEVPPADSGVTTTDEPVATVIPDLGSQAVESTPFDTPAENTQVGSDVPASADETQDPTPQQ